MKKVGVVILNYKVCDQAIKCAKSVQKSTYGDVEIIVVDNNSRDGIDEALSDNKDIIFIQTGGNLGYTGGNNIGIRKALENKADYIFILNADTTIEEDAIGNLVTTAELQDVGIAGPKILFADEKKDIIWYGGGTIDLANVLGKHRGLDEKDLGQYDKIEETEFITGGAMFVRRDVFEKVGFFDDKYFMYLEDADLCFRAKRAGFKILYVPTAQVFHKNAQSAGLGSPRQDYFLTRNRMLFASKFLSFRTKFALFREAIRNIGIPARRLALIDFLLGDLGKGHVVI